MGPGRHPCCRPELRSVPSAARRRGPRWLTRRIGAKLAMSVRAGRRQPPFAGAPMSEEERQETTDALTVLRRGAPEGVDRLLPLVYAELRRIAHRQLAAEAP